MSRAGVGRVFESPIGYCVVCSRPAGRLQPVNVREGASVSGSTTSLRGVRQTTRRSSPRTGRVPGPARPSVTALTVTCGRDDPVRAARNNVSQKIERSGETESMRHVRRCGVPRFTDSILFADFAVENGRVVSGSCRPAVDPLGAWGSSSVRESRGLQSAVVMWAWQSGGDAVAVHPPNKTLAACCLAAREDNLPDESSNLSSPLRQGSTVGDATASLAVTLTRLRRHLKKQLAGSIPAPAMAVPVPVAASSVNHLAGTQRPSVGTLDKPKSASVPLEITVCGPRNPSSGCRQFGLR